jgi:hypothetical protein
MELEMGNWYEQLRERLPDGEVAKQLVEAVETLPGIDAWNPKHGLTNKWLDIVRWGLPLHMVRTLPGLDGLRERLAGEILYQDQPNAADLGELNAGALCVALGAVAGGRIPEEEFKTADWYFEWPDGPVEVEATTAATKKEHLRRRSAAFELLDVFHEPTDAVDTVIHIVDPTSKQDTRELLDAVASNSIATIEKPGHWQVRKVPISREITTIYAPATDDPPIWWSAEDVRLSCFRSFIAGPESKAAPTQSRLHWAVPYSAYINPVMKKADEPQGSIDAPFLIATDISALPAGMRELPKAMSGFWDQWTRVSGVLIFHEFVGIGRAGWFWRLLANSHAAVPLPDSLLKHRANLETQETWLSLSRPAPST